MTANAMRTYLRDTIKVASVTGPSPAAIIISVQDEGLLEIIDLLDFDKEGIKALFNSFRNPGGMIEDSNNVNFRITNPGDNIPEICENRLKGAIYTAKVYAMIR